MKRKRLEEVDVSIRDFELLSQIEPGGILAYLESHGWARRLDRPGDRLHFYTKEFRGSTATVTLPTSREVDYYALHIRTLIDKVSAVDGRGALQTLEILAGDLLDIGARP